MSPSSRVSKWFSPRSTPVQLFRKKVAPRRPAKIALESLEDRLAPAVVNYTAATDLLSFTADVGQADNVTVTAPAANSLRIVVAAGDTISLTGDVSTGFTLSAGNTQLDINTASAPAANFNVNLGDQADTLAFGLVSTPNGVTNVNLQGDAGTDTITLNALTVTGKLTVASETVNLGGIVTASGDVSLTAVNSLTDGADDDVADIAGAVVSLNVTGAGNTIGSGAANYLEINAAVRLDASASNGNIAVSDVSGDLPLGVVNAGAGTVLLVATNGAITDTNGATLNITGGIVDLNAKSGIGSSADPIETTASALVTTVTDSGAVTNIAETDGLSSVSAKTNAGDVTIAYTVGGSLSFTASTQALSAAGAGAAVSFETTSGDIKLGVVNTGTSDISIVATNGAITDNNGATLNITGGIVNLNAKSGIGSSGDPIEIDVATRLNATATNGNMFLSNVNNLPLGVLNAGAGFIQLNVAGAITDGNAGVGAANLTAANGVNLTTTGLNSAIGTNALPIRTAIGALTATTNDGGIFIADSNAALIINSVLANEKGQTPFLSSNQIVVYDPPAPTNPHHGTKDVSISAQGPILLGTVAAPDAVTITSVVGSILDLNQASTNILAQSVNLVTQGAAAGRAVGQTSDPIELTVERFSAGTMNGGIFLAQGIDGPAVSVVAGGAGNDVVVTSSAARLRIQTITATRNVTVANNGGSLIDDNGAAVNITAGQIVDLTGRSGIGTAADPLETNTTSDLRATVSDPAAGLTPAASIYIDNKNGGLVALNAVAAKTNAGHVTINFLGGTLLFTANTDVPLPPAVLSASGAAVTFETTSGDVKLALVDAGSKDVSVTAAGVITDDTNDAAVDLRGGTVTLKAGTGIGASGNEIDTDVTTLSATTTTGGIFIREASALTVSAATTSDDIDVRNATGDMTVKVVSAPGQVTLHTVGAILDGNGTANNVSANTLDLLASTGIGTASAGLGISVNSLTAAGGSGGLFVANSKALTLTSATATVGGDVSVSAIGNLTLGTVTATGIGADVTLTAFGALIDGNGGATNITANSATLNATIIGPSGDKIETVAAAITAATTTGGIFVTNTATSLALNATALGQAADIDIDTTGDIVLGVATAQGDLVKLRTGPAGKITDGNDPPPPVAINITAKKLDLVAAGGIGTSGNPLEMDVDLVVKADGGGNTNLTNAGPLLLTETSLETSGSGTLTFDAESITIDNILDNTARIPDGRSVVLRTQTGAIVFLDTADTIETTGAGTITIQAGTVDGSGAVAVLGNLKTAGGNIRVQADHTITIGELNAGAGDVTVQSLHGIIIDGNAAALNVIAGTTTLSGAAPTARAAELDETFRIAEAAATNSEAAAKQVSADAFAAGKAIMDAAQATAEATVEADVLASTAADSAIASQESVVDGLETTALVLEGVSLGLDIAHTIAETLADAAQAIPLTGDIGAAEIANVLELASLGAAAAALAINVSLNIESAKLDDLQDTGVEAHAQQYAAESTLTLAIASAQAYAESTSITTAAAEKAAIVRDAAERVRDQAILGRDQVNVIGTPAAPLGLQVTGVINVTAGPTDSYLQVVGDTAVDLIQTTGSVSLISTGAISDFDAGNGADILGTGLRIVAVGGIGSNDPLETRVASLNAANTSGGDIAIHNTAGTPGPLDITSVSNAGGGDVDISNQGNTAAGQGITVSGPISATGAGADVTIHSGSPLTISSDVTAAGTIVLEAGETAGPGDKLTVNPDVTIQSTGSSVTLRAGDNVTVLSGSTIQANSTITITADYNDDVGDTTGANVIVAGSLIGTVVFIGVDAAANDNDTFTITPSATTPITVDAEDGIDTLNFIADGLPVTIVGNQITALGRAPVTFLNFEFVNLVNASGGGSVTLLTAGGAADDLNLTGTGQEAGTFTLNGGVPIAFSGVSSFSYHAGDMNDTTTVSPFATSVLPWNVAVAIAGGDGVDRITYNNVAGILDTTSVTATTAQAGHIDAPGVTSALHSQLVSFSNVEKLTVNANPGEDEKLTVNLRDSSTPDTANLLLNAAPGTDNLQLVGLFDLIIDTNNYVGLTLNGRGGDDAFNITPGSIPVFVDGGDPIGVTAGDAINFNVPGNYVLEPGPEGDEGGLVADGAQRVSWDHIEASSVTGGGGGGGGGGTFLGTNGDDVITITIVNEGDYIVSVNDGDETHILNQSVINVDGQSGNDTVIVKTPGTQDVTYTPGSADSAILNIPSLTTMIVLTGAEEIDYQGDDGDTLTLNGTAVDDTFVVDPTNGGEGSHDSNLAPKFDYDGATAVTANGGTGGFDALTVLGTEGADTFTSAGDVISVVGGGTVTIGGNIDRVDVSTFGGNDSVNLTGVTVPTVIRSGDGDDILIGSPQADIIYAGTGNDILIGNAGTDQEYGEEGNDRFGDLLTTGNGVADDPGNDFLFGGDGTDEFIWEPGDGNDVIEGGDAGTDILYFFGSAGVADTVDVQPAPGAPTHLNILLGAETVDAHGVEQLIVTGRTGGDTFNVADLTTTETEHVTLDVTPGGTDNVTVNGRAADDNIFISTPAPGTVDVLGLEYDVRLLNLTTADRLTFQGNEGDDTIKADADIADTVLLTLDGGTGNDSLSADGTLIGGAGDDFLEGGAGANLLFGGDGRDTMVGGLGNDTFDGGADFDTILVRGTAADDVVDVFQNAPGAAAGSGYGLAWSINAVSQPDTIAQDTPGSPQAAGTRPTVEEVRIEAGLGNDLIRVGVSDAYSDLNASNGAPNQSLRFDVQGDAPNGNDRLVVQDDGVGDLVALYESPDLRSGRVSVAPGATTGGGTGLADVVYAGIDRLDITPLDPVTSGTGTDGKGRVVVFHTDPFESNDSRLNAGQLARVGQNVTSPSIAPGGLTTPFSTNGDEDWYEFRPTGTNTFQIKILFDKVQTLSNGRAGLPGDGDLSLDIYDANGALITSGVADANGNNRTATFAATNDLTFSQFNRIFVRVKGAGAQPSLSINRYDFHNLSGSGSGIPGASVVDTNGPQVTGVNIVNNPLTPANESAYNVFDPKPATGPTPLVPRMEVHFTDGPFRAPGLLYPAIDPHLFDGTPGHRPAMGLFTVVGDLVGNVPILDVVLTNDPVVQGQPATATVTIIFDLSSPTFALGLPDDRYTLTVLDQLSDPSGSKLDGESKAAQPTTVQSFPSGDGKAGGDFVARFTVDSRPEIGTFGNNKVFIDLNGNGIWDPQGSGDTVHHDNSFAFGLTTDTQFAGNFAAVGATTANGYDKLGAYGKVNGQNRFLLDLDGDGYADLSVVPTLQINGLPVAGDFALGHPGQEFGVFLSGKWTLDTNGNNNIDFADLTVTNGLNGLPLVGDFDGDGKFDLATYNPSSNTFFFDLASNGYGQLDTTINFGYPTVKELAVAADMNRDGVTDVGLFVPRSDSSSETLTSDWYFLVSQGTPTAGSVSTLNHAFNQTPFSNDRFFTFGDSFYQPLVGNFDPPVTNGLGGPIGAPLELAGNRGLLVAEGGGVTISRNTLRVTDLDVPNVPVTYTVTALPANGVLRVSGIPVTVGTTFTQRDIDLRHLRFAHDGGETAADSFEFTVAGSKGGALGPMTVAIKVQRVNDAPTLGGNGTALTAIAEGTRQSAGDVVSAIVGDTITDADSTALRGIAVIRATGGHGTWQYSTNGGATWRAFGLVSASQALLLRDTDRVRFVPAANFNGLVSLLYRAWDRTAGIAGRKANLSAATLVGGSKAFSAATAMVTLTVTPVNDAPTLVAGSAPVVHGGESGATASALLAGALGRDVDGPVVFGLAVTATTGDGWEYSRDGGATWLALGAVDASHVRLLEGDARLRRRSGVVGPARLSFRAWDGTLGVAGETGDLSAAESVGGSTAFSQVSVNAVWKP